MEERDFSQTDVLRYLQHTKDQVLLDVLVVTKTLRNMRMGKEKCLSSR